MEIEGESHVDVLKSPMKMLLIHYASRIPTERQFSHCVM